MTKRMEWRGRGRQEQARASGRLCCVLWHVGCVLPGSVRADRISQARQAGTHQRKSALPSPSPGPSPGPSPKPSTANPSTYVPIQFNSPGHSAAVSIQPSTVSCSLPRSVHPELSLCLRLRLPPSIDLRYVTSRACQSSAPSLPSNGVAANLFVSNFPLQQDRPDQHRHCSSTVTICFPPSIASFWRLTVHPCHQLASIFPSPPILNANNACIHVDSHRPPALFPPNAPRHHVAQPSSLCLTRAVRNLLLRLLQRSTVQLTTTLLSQSQPTRLILQLLRQKPRVPILPGRRLRRKLPSQLRRTRHPNKLKVKTLFRLRLHLHRLSRM